MDPSYLVLAACGAAGAMIYSFPLYLKGIAQTPPTAFALANFLFSVFVGVISATIFTHVIGFHWPWTVKPQPWPLAVVIGLASNPVVPRLVSKIEAFVESFQGKPQ